MHINRWFIRISVPIGNSLDKNRGKGKIWPCLFPNTNVAIKAFPVPKHSSGLEPSIIKSCFDDFLKKIGRLF